MALIVQKYGGSSVADAESIKRVAKRIVDTRRAGHEVVVAVSAMGDTTDEMLDLAGQVAPIPAPRNSTCSCPAGSASRWRCWLWRSTRWASKRARSPAARRQ